MTKFGIALGIFLASWNLTLAAAMREEQWKAVEEAVQKGLPQSAIQALEPIIAAALQDRAYGEAAKATLRKIHLQGTIQGNKPEEKVRLLEAQIAIAPKELVPFYESVLANWYWHYFQNNRWRFMRRTATATSPGKDFTTWDLPRLFTEIDRHFAASLGAPEVLKTTRIQSFEDLLEKGNVPDTYRPTLYDFIAHEALKFYTAGEQAGARPQDTFEVAADSAALGPVKEFLAWEIKSPDTNATGFKALRLFQDLLRFHEKDTDPTAFLDLDLGRLAYGHSIAHGEQKQSRYIARLKEFTEQWADHELTATALHQWARVLHGEGNLVEAHSLAERGAKTFPDSLGAKACRNLVREIEAKELAVQTERVWNQPWPKIQVRYRNITRVHFRAVPYQWESFLARPWGRPENLDEEQRTKLLAAAPVRTWSAELRATTNYQERLESIPVATGLKPGFYYVIASVEENFRTGDNPVQFTDVWVSDLAVVLRTREGAIEGFVLNANSGEPISGAEVESWYRDQQGKFVANAKEKTDKEGFFKVKENTQRGCTIRVRHRAQELASHSDYHAPRRDRAPSHEQTFFFTDRAIYRPGQMIQYKGIAVRSGIEEKDYTLLPGRRLTVIFNDPNGKEIARQQQQCNEFGSFAGTFVAPRDRLMGRMILRVQDGPAGSTAVQVEEYKRPKFQVTLETPKTAARLEEKVRVGGKATAFTGAAIDGAEVRYRVVREVRYPYWWHWFGFARGGHTTGSQEIAHGTVRTELDGGFRIEFTARPDLSITATNEPVFIFSVHADVTDAAGETRSADTRLRIGYTALQASISGKEWQTPEKPVELTLKTETLDGEAQKAEGSIRIYGLEEPGKVQRPPLGPIHYGQAAREEDMSDPNHWPLGQLVVEKGFTTDEEGKGVFQFALKAGAYRAVVETQDRFGKKVKAFHPLQVLDPKATRLGIKVPQVLVAEDWSVEPGEEFMALWGTGYDTGRAFIEIEQRNEIVERFWTAPGRTQQTIQRRITEAMRGGFMLHVTQVRENRAYLVSRLVEVPWTNKELDLEWEHFTSKLEPSQKETWTLVVRPVLTNASKSTAELVAALYDASLDVFRPHGWPEGFGIFRNQWSGLNATFENHAKQFQWLRGNWSVSYESAEVRYRQFPQEIVMNWLGYQFGRGRMLATRAKGAESLGLAETAAMAPPASPAPAQTFFAADKVGGVAEEALAASEPAPAGPKVNLEQVKARKNLNETAFFYPKLMSDKDGVVRIQFTMPEALTEWRFLGFAHDQSLRSGFLEGRTVTARELMVQPNPPRFVREGDELEFTVKVSNQSAARQTGVVRLSFTEVTTEKNADAALGNRELERRFDIPAKESRAFFWRISVPDGLGFLSYKTVGSTGRVSDGEEGYLPVLSRRILLTESLPLPIRGAGTKKFEFPKLLQAGGSETLRHQSLTFQMVSQPAWYAVLALPYLTEYPYECSEQVFNRLYANSLARNIANSDPQIRRIFDQWKSTPALDSPLEKNQDLKSVMLEETPWLRQAKKEGEARRNVGIMFEDNRLNYELERNRRKLLEMQLPDGAWPWFPGGPPNDYITLYIATGIGRLRHLGVDISPQPALAALNRLDGWINDRYQDILRNGDKEANHLTSTIALYLYCRSFFLKDKSVSPSHKEAVEYFIGQARKFWLDLGHRQSQGHLALALHRLGHREDAAGIMRSLRERAVTDDDMGMFWRELELSWWWYRAPIETQALMIEAFDEVAGDAEAVEACRVWLLKQKQTQDWKTTKATADAVYSLLLRGRNLLASDALVQIQAGNLDLTPKKGPALEPDRVNPEPGTGFYEKRFSAAEIKPELGRITLRKTDEGVAWGSVHWQYLEDMAKVTPHEGTPLKLTKTLFKKMLTNRGPVLEPARALKVGDELVVRIELRTDRDMEYVHLKDQRGSGTEPVNVISQYRFQDGLRYYESTRDTASHFFIDYLPKGVYVFEYSSRIQHRGDYQAGVAEIQCMYAPEFNSHSASLPIKVGN